MARVGISEPFEEKQVCPSGRFALRVTKVIEKTEKTNFDGRPGTRDVFFFVISVEKVFGEGGKWFDLPDGEGYDVLVKTNRNYGNKEGSLTLFLDALFGSVTAKDWAHRCGDTDTLLGMPIIGDVENSFTVGGKEVADLLLHTAKVSAPWLKKWTERGYPLDPSYASVPIAPPARHIPQSVPESDPNDYRNRSIYDRKTQEPTTTRREAEDDDFSDLSDPFAE